MTCQRIGRYPSTTIGLGMVSEYSLSRIPNPPQKRTTLMPISPVPRMRVSCGSFYQQFRLDQLVRCPLDGREGEARSHGDVEQAVVAIGLVQDPEQGLLIRPEGRIEAPLSQLRLAPRGPIDEHAVFFQDVENRRDRILARAARLGGD